MFASLKTAALSTMIGLGALAAMPATAQADGLYLNFGGKHEPRVGVYLGDNDGRVVRHRDRWDNGDRWARLAACTPNRALDKAERMGIRRARIADVDRRSITVSGRSRGDRVFVTFARSPRCPVIG